MGRTKKLFRLKKRGDVWYYKIEDMGNFKSTRLTSKAKAEKEVMNLIKNDTVRKKNLTFREYADSFFIYDKCPHVTRLKTKGKNQIRISQKNILLIAKKDIQLYFRDLNYSLKQYYRLLCLSDISSIY